MHSKVVKGVEYNLYSDEAEFREKHPKEEVIEDWRSAIVGQWIKSDDGKIMQIIERWSMKDTSTPSKKKNDFIKTLMGIASTGKYTKLAGEPAKKVHCFINYKQGGNDTFREEVCQDGGNGCQTGQCLLKLL